MGESKNKGTRETIGVSLISLETKPEKVPQTKKKGTPILLRAMGPRQLQNPMFLDARLAAWREQRPLPAWFGWAKRGKVAAQDPASNNQGS